jgi:phosphatidylserine/phosphatidylglycerophosphate/cardiolipin synthase-like enzyme
MRPSESYKLADQPGVITLIESLSNAGICIIQQAGLHQKFAVIDQNIVWYGSINLLGYGFGDESMMRLENAEVAGELLKITE